MTSQPESGPVCRLFSLEQAAAHAGVPIGKVRHWIKAGKLKTYRLHRGRLRIGEVDLANLISSPDSKRP